ncbi:MAG TPA: hypothetical protein VFE51_16135 [Verrucomicrobiae bacterium]|nr:hypothetical protein [Verrucomicrobiae bacterium]
MRVRKCIIAGLVGLLGLSVWMAVPREVPAVLYLVRDSPAVLKDATGAEWWVPLEGDYS